ncbi:hypothetical protein SASPL_152655 [Salvia splendens]|uniref:Sulfotransferase n=1 Tax=Salvia splendens TaxID=180675 RepID=A0A8X8W3D9_SALSN|nr:hypothetical protein SASPL_152655 [Salvia splendens]
MHKLVGEHPHELVPFLEAPVFAEVDESATLAAASNGPRLFATHIPYQLLTKTLDSSQCKVVYLTRNPKDTLVSLWHFVIKWNMEKPNQSWPLMRQLTSFEEEEEATTLISTRNLQNGYHRHAIHSSEKGKYKIIKTIFVKGALP